MFLSHLLEPRRAAFPTCSAGRGELGSGEEEEKDRCRVAIKCAVPDPVAMAAAVKVQHKLWRHKCEAAKRERAAVR